MTIEQLLGHTGEQLAAMSDEQLTILLEDSLKMEPFPHRCDPLVGTKEEEKARKKAKKENGLLGEIKSSILKKNEKVMDFLSEELPL